MVARRITKSSRPASPPHPNIICAAWHVVWTCILQALPSSPLSYLLVDEHIRLCYNRQSLCSGKTRLSPKRVLRVLVLLRSGERNGNKACFAILADAGDISDAAARGFRTLCDLPEAGRAVLIRLVGLSQSRHLIEDFNVLCVYSYQFDAAQRTRQRTHSWLDNCVRVCTVLCMHVYGSRQRARHQHHSQSQSRDFRVAGVHQARPSVGAGAVMHQKFTVTLLQNLSFLDTTIWLHDDP